MIRLKTSQTERQQQGANAKIPLSHEPAQVCSFKRGKRRAETKSNMNGLNDADSNQNSNEENAKNEPH